MVAIYDEIGEVSKSDLYFFFCTWGSKRKSDDVLECPNVEVSCSTQPPDVYPSQLPEERGYWCEYFDANGMILRDP